MRPTELVTVDTASSQPRRARGGEPLLVALAVAGPSGPAARRVATSLALLAGAGLVAASALIHLYLWADGYRHVTTIGPLFLAQGIVGLALAVLLVACPRVLAASVGVGYLLATLVGLVLSASVGFLGFMDTFDAPWAGTSLVVESVGTLTLTVGAVLCVRTT
jgi:hypothetical protein